MLGEPAQPVEAVAMRLVAWESVVELVKVVKLGLLGLVELAELLELAVRPELVA